MSATGWQNAGLLRVARFGPASISEGSQIVCTVTGHGLKDLEIIAAGIVSSAPVPPNEPAVRRAIAAARS